MVIAGESCKKPKATRKNVVSSKTKTVTKATEDRSAAMRNSVVTMANARTKSPTAEVYSSGVENDPKL